MAKQLGSYYFHSPYKFNGKELYEETGFYYYGARYYDPRVSIWMSADLMAEKYPNVNGYVYCKESPVVFVDPDGRKVDTPPGDYFSIDGKTYLGSDNIDDKKIYISQGNKTNFLTADKTEVPGGLVTLTSIKTSLLLTNSPSSHQIPDTKGGNHEVRVDVDSNGISTFTTGGKSYIDSDGIARGGVNSIDMNGRVNESNSVIVGHSHPTATIIENGSAYTFKANEPTADDLISFKNHKVNFISGNIERQEVTRNLDGSYNTPINKQGAVFYDSSGAPKLTIQSKVVDNIISHYSYGKIKK